MATSKEWVLYGYFRSSASYRVRIAMELKGLSYEYHAVHLVKGGGEQYSAEYAALNPSREVPTLIHHGQNHTPITIAQSIAIVDYLDTAAPTPRLFPIDPAKRALVFQACEIINSGAQPIGNLRVLKQLVEKFGATEAQKEEWMKYWILYGLETMDTFLTPYAGEHCFGDEVTAADCFLMPHIFNADRFKVSLDAFPRLQRIRETCDASLAFQKAAPAAQPDFPKA